MICYNITNSNRCLITLLMNGAEQSIFQPYSDARFFLAKVNVKVTKGIGVFFQLLKIHAAKYSKQNR